MNLGSRPLSKCYLLFAQLELYNLHTHHTLLQVREWTAVCCHHPNPKTLCTFLGCVGNAPFFFLDQDHIQKYMLPSPCVSSFLQSGVVVWTLVVKSRLPWKCSCLIFPSAEVTDMCHHTRLLQFFCRPCVVLDTPGSVWCLLVTRYGLQFTRISRKWQNALLSKSLKETMMGQLSQMAGAVYLFGFFIFYF